MRSSKTLLMVAGLSMLSSGCGMIAKPEVRDVRGRVSGLDLQGVSMVFEVDVYNPYFVPLTAPRFRCGMDISEKEFFSSQDEVKIDLPAGKVGTAQLPARIEFLKLWQTYQALANSEEVDYRLHGTVIVSAMGESFDLPLEHRGKFPVFRAPSFSNPKANVGNVSLAGAKVEVAVDVRNPNVFALGLSDLGYAIRLGEVEVGNIRAATIGELAPGQTGRLVLTGEVGAAKAARQLMGGQSVGKPTIACIGAVTTPFGPVQLGR